MKIYRRPVTTRTGEPVLDPATGQQLVSNCYYYTFTHAGCRITRVTPYRDARRAQQLAQQRLRELQEGALASDLPTARAARAIPGRDTTLRQLCDTYERTPLDAAPDTRRKNVLVLQRIVATALGVEMDAALTVTLDQLSPDLLTRYRAARQQLCEAPGIDQTTTAALQRTTNSNLRKALSVFNPRVLRALGLAGLKNLPDFNAFRTAAIAERFHRIPKLTWNPPSDETLAATLAAWTQLTDRNLCLAAGLCLACGLRAGEAAQARWHWFTLRNGAPFLDAQAEVKNGSGTIQLTPLDPWFAQFQATIEARGWRGAPGDHLITGPDTTRHDTIWRDLADWLTALGWNTQKKAHALRAYAGSMIALKYGIYDASRWLRHSSVKVTESHYTYFLGRQQGLPTEANPIRWATQPAQPFTPKSSPHNAEVSEPGGPVRLNRP